MILVHLYGVPRILRTWNDWEKFAKTKVSNDSLITSTIGTSANKGSPVDYFTNMTRGAELKGSILLHLYINLHGSDQPDKPDRREDWYIEQCSFQVDMGEAVDQADFHTPGQFL